MKKKLLILCVCLLAAAVLCFPVKTQFKEGGTAFYSALAYRVIVWHAISPSTDENDTHILTGTDVYLFPRNFHDYEYYFERRFGARFDKTETPTTGTATPEQGSVLLFQYGGLQLEITNVASASEADGLDHGTDPYSYTIYTLYPGAHLHVIQADMYDGSNTDEGMPYAKWYVCAENGGEYIPITDNMPPLALTLDMTGVFQEFPAPLVFEWFGVPAEPEDSSQRIYSEIFETPIRLYSYFASTSPAYDFEDTCKLGDATYYRVTDPQFPTMTALEATLREVFSEELTRKIMGLSVFADPAYIENDGKLYTRMGDRGGSADSVAYSVRSQSENKVVYRALVNYGERMPAGQPTEESFDYTRELIDGRWVFTEFPMEWW